MSKQLFKVAFCITYFIGLISFAQNTTRPNVAVPNGFEVNSYTGNLYQSRTDMKIPGQGLNIDITFSYNVSRRSKNWGMGKGWTFTYNMAYTTDQLGVWVERPDGRRDFYRKSGAIYIAPAGIYDDLIEYQSGKFYVKTKDDLRYYFDNTSHKRLTKMQDANGNAINIAYNDTLISTLTDGSGHSIAFTWANSKLTEITDNTCTPTRKVTYTYDAKGNPTKVTNPIGDFIKYVYDPSSRVIGYTDESGNNMSMTYNTNGAVTRITSCITTHLFSYLPQQLKTYVTEKVNGQSVVTTYAFDNQGRVISKKGNCCGYNVDYTYDAQNNVSNRKDGNKKETIFEYDAKGNITKETDPAGNLTTYTYESTHNKVASMTDKNGNVTAYQYDAKGNIIQINKPLSVTEKYTYDTKGKRLSYTDGNNNNTAYEYNTRGNITKITDPEGGITTYTYDCYDNRLTETNPRGHTTTYQYNALNQLVKVTDALNHFTTYTYNKQGQITATTNPLGKTTQYSYDGLGRRISTILPMGNTTYTEYDEQGNIVKETDANGNTTTYTYNNRKQPLAITDALGNTMSYEYDEAGNKLSETDKNGNTTRFEYDDQYRLIKRIDALGGINQYNYDALGNKIAEINANGNAITHEYDALQRVIKITDPLGKMVQYTYDGNGNQLTQKDKNGNTTTNTYDKLNRTKTITNALGGIITYTYDANGNITSEKDPLNHISTSTFDALDRRLTNVNALNETTIFTYDATGNEKTVNLTNGNTITNVYNDNGQLISSSDELDVLATYTFDNNGNTLTEKDGNNNIKTYVYDALNRQIQIKDALNKTTIFNFDKNGNLASQTDRNGNTRSETYDALNRKVTETDALGNTTRFTHDALGNRLSIIDAKGNITSYNYDASNQLVKETYADGTYQQYTYDANGNRKTRRDGRGNITTYTYDGLNRLTVRSYPNNTQETFSYDAAGRRLTANNLNANITFTYDNVNRLLSETLNGKTTSYAYNITNRTQTLTYPSGKVIVEERNKRGNLITIKEGATTHAAFTYNTGNKLTQKVLANGFTTSYAYNANGLLTSLVCNPNNLINFNYTYDHEGNRLTALKSHRPTHSEKYIYDDINQLIGFFTGTLTPNILNDTISKNHYTYDALHNRKASYEDGINNIYVTNSQNAYTAINTNGQEITYTYDANGNMLSEGSKNFGYNFENQLIAINGNSTITNFYDALGRRIKTVTPTETTNFYFANNKVLENRDYTDGVQNIYIYGTWLDDVIAYTTPNNLYYLLNNEFGSVLAITNQNNLLERYEYKAFGDVSYFSSNFQQISNSIVQNSILFNGRMNLKDNEFLDFRARGYQVKNGRFLQKDLLSYEDGFNLYFAFLNSPISKNDIYGLKSRSICSKPEAQDYYDSKAFGFHQYKVNNKICSFKNEPKGCNDNGKDNNCNIQTVFNMMLTSKKFIAPTEAKGSVSNCSVTVVNIPGADQVGYTSEVVTKINLSEHNIINYTLLTHALHPGKVTRTVVSESDGIYVKTYGIGTGKLGFINEWEWLTNRVWGPVDKNLIDAYDKKYKD